MTMAGSSLFKDFLFFVMPNVFVVSIFFSFFAFSGQSTDVSRFRNESEVSRASVACNYSKKLTVREEDSNMHIVFLVYINETVNLFIAIMC